MKLREYLREKNLNPTEFSLLAGCGFSTIYRFLRGKAFTVETALKIEAATDGLVTVKELLEEKDGK